ncbi:MAG: Gfo/Idh/MocA family oxidoreductase [Bacteroidota bacterium]|nr:Gfo/Idh/MocA family oxidoreductase [Bacteroidota bacterium]MDP3147265.1 Gfo/Idh/MocA family oxidoreductase [Bacteroidota bacterium]MDP3557361.1 Gfo/Idh/MocA family oxidoreductase [Bacteroidota bacterium]
MINKIALVGLGVIGKIHLKLLIENPNWDLVGIYDIDKVLCKDIATQYNLKAFESLEEAIEHAEVLDIVTTTNSHFEIAKQAIINGKHVFIKKPVSENIKEAKTLQNYITEAGICFQVGHSDRYNPAFIAAKPYLNEPKYIEVERLAQYNQKGSEVSVVLDLMMNELDLILSIVKSNIKKIHVSGCNLVGKTADIINARIEFENGCVANITTNRMAFRNTRKFAVYTDEHFVNINLLDKITEVVKVKNAEQNSKNLTVDPGKGFAKKEINFEHPIILPTNAINQELNAFHDSINSNKKPVFGIDEAIILLDLAIEIEENLIL